MLNIELRNIKPTYMAENEVAASDVYCKKINLEQGKKYLIKANSGHGKSSVLNFIYGSNNKYDGSITMLSSRNNEDVQHNFLSTITDSRRSIFSYVFQDFKALPPRPFHEM